MARYGQPGTCRGCGCTDDMACDGGCAWLDRDETICSRCGIAIEVIDADFRAALRAAARSLGISLVPSPKGYDGLVALVSPMEAYQFGAEMMKRWRARLGRT
jgi:hypothetical protein